MYEVELKVPADHGPVRERLDALGAEPLGAVEQADTYFDHPSRDFAETDEALRVRRERQVARDERDDAVDSAGEPAGTAELELGDPGAVDATVTYKGPLVEAESKTRQEVETGVDDGESMRAALRSLGFEAVETVEKRRERFRVDECIVALDAVDGLGEYVEVEIEVEGPVELEGDVEGVTDADVEGVVDDGSGGDAVEPAREVAIALLETLGLQADDQIRTSYLELSLDEEA